MRPRTFHIQTLGCRVNQYEAEQMAAHLRSRGLTPTDADTAHLCLVHTCSVTVQAASKSRQWARRLSSSGKSTVSLTVLPLSPGDNPHHRQTASEPGQKQAFIGTPEPRRLILTGCWASSDPEEARALRGVDAVVTHQDDVAARLDQLLQSWTDLGELADGVGVAGGSALALPNDCDVGCSTIDVAGKNPLPNDTSIQVGLPHPVGLPLLAGQPDHSGSPELPIAAVEIASGDPLNTPTKTHRGEASSTAFDEIRVNRKIDPPASAPGRGFASLGLLDGRQAARQRAYLKIQDGCDAHCTYCIIPRLRPNLWSKPIDDCVEEARRLVAGGHREIVLTGIFLSAFGQATALRRRQPSTARSPLALLVETICTQVPELVRLRLSSLEPGDLAGDLLETLAAHEQVVPHFHLPLQSGCDRLLRKMNRQYNREDFLRMLDDVHARFDRPGLTTDVIAGFPGEDDAAFDETADVVRRGGFIHVHAFHYSARPGTAAARWTDAFVRGPVVNDRVLKLREIAARNSLALRKSFVGQTVQVLIEHGERMDDAIGQIVRHGRSERYFPVELCAPGIGAGDLVTAEVISVEGERTLGRLSGRAGKARAEPRTVEATL